MLTSTSAAPGSLLKHMVMVFRAILKKLVKDTDFPCKKETRQHETQLPKHTHTHSQPRQAGHSTSKGSGTTLANTCLMQQFVVAPKGSEVAERRSQDQPAAAIRPNYTLDGHFVPRTEVLKSKLHMGATGDEGDTVSPTWTRGRWCSRRVQVWRHLQSVSPEPCVNTQLICPTGLKLLLNRVCVFVCVSEALTEG